MGFVTRGVWVIAGTIGYGPLWYAHWWWTARVGFKGLWVIIRCISRRRMCRLTKSS